MQGCVLGEDVADLRFELGEKNRAVESELVLVVVQKSGRFPDESTKPK